MWQEEHARAFTVAKVARLDLLETIRASIDDAARNGGTFEMWKDRLQPELEKAGWWGRVKDRSLTGTDAAVMVGPRRLKTIFTTNMRVSRAASQWARIQRYKGIRPFLRYVTVGDHKVRHQHRLWHDTILPVDHAWWHEHFPPNGWNCRCTVQQLDQATMDRRGWSVSAAPPPEGPSRRFYKPGTKERVLVPDGFDPGWAYNPGMASLRAVGDKAASSIESAARSGGIAAARETLDELVASHAYRSFLAAGDPQLNLPVMVLDDAMAAKLGTEARTVVMSGANYTKQLARHPDLEADVYRRLPDIGADPDQVYEESDQKLIFTKRDGEHWLKVGLKTTRDRSGLYFLTMQRVREREISRLKRLLSLLFERAEDE